LSPEKKLSIHIDVTDFSNMTSVKNIIFTGSIARSANCQYLIYSEADFKVFAPQGRHVAPMGVKFGVEEGTSTPIFTPIGATTRV